MCPVKMSEFYYLVKNGKTKIGGQLATTFQVQTPISAGEVLIQFE